MTYKMQAVIWVVLSSGISSHPVVLLHPVELQQKLGTLQIISLLQSVGAGLVSFFCFNLSYWYQSWNRDNPIFQESQLKITACFPSPFSTLGTKANPTLCNPPASHPGPARWSLLSCTGPCTGSRTGCFLLL